jgi:hypothetical protein
VLLERERGRHRAYERQRVRRASWYDVRPSTLWLDEYVVAGEYDGVRRSGVEGSCLSGSIVVFSSDTLSSCFVFLISIPLDSPILV